jgi:predicted AlkP superfamily phosphohydrolase/phosphomutase
LKHINVYLNAFLKREGFLYIDGDRRGLSGITKKTQAFALDPNRIYINIEGRYPRGSVKQSERERVVEDLITAFRDLAYNGNKVIREIYRREEVYHGNYLDHAPDLLLIPNSGFNLMARPEGEKVFGVDNLTGMHNPEAFIYTNQDIELDNPSVEDVLKIMGWKYEYVS